MKDSEFIELLNLYLDHEITPADAARLEAEVQSSPARRRTYQQYCRMQKACKVLAAEFVTVGGDAAASADKQVIAFDPASAADAAAQRRRARGFYTAGGLMAAAACVAFVLVNRGERSGAAQAELMVQAGASPVPVAASAAVPVPTTARGGITVATFRPQGVQVQPTLMADQLLLSNSPANAALTAAMPEASNNLVWVRNLQLAPLQQRMPVEELRFDAQPTTLRPGARTLGDSRAQTEATLEMTAFRFVK